jgi:hypothetical protein
MYINELKYLVQYAPSEILLQSENGIILHNGHKLKTDFLVDILNSFYHKYTISNDTKPLVMRLSSDILQKKFHTYKPYINFLLDNGFFEKSRNHLKGTRCNEYKFIRSFDECKFKAYINYDSSKHKRLLKFYNNPDNFKRKSPVISDEVLSYSIRNLNNVNLDYEKALSFLKSMSTDEKKFARNLLSITKIKHNHIYANPDGYGRLHTNFTVLKKEIRTEYLTIDGEGIAEIDIKNSQPFFLLKLINDNRQLIVEYGDDLMVYFNKVINGNLYEYIQEKSNINNRSEVKKWTYKVLFSNMYVEHEVFRNIFPAVYQFIQSYKKKFGYKELSHKLQLIESNFIFNKVCKRLMDKGIIYFTVHDSVCVKISEFKVAEEIFNIELQKMLESLRPSFQNLNNDDYF